jgi:hypothetical protein
VRGRFMARGDCICVLALVVVLLRRLELAVTVVGGVGRRDRLGTNIGKTQKSKTVTFAQSASSCGSSV